ncbi:CoA transferase subunit A [Desulfospira joergensenii]|uniref:CoA transferase subunit A n=1 Tax=Desulfospira joergensenii TaxID=53329 RepID=UPI0003B50DA3|nr:CoA-transferase [Desulfospira joergensenii]
MENEKVMDLATAVDRFVKNGSHISIGGFTVNRNPMAAVYEIIRQGKKDLHMYAHSNGQGVDELAGAGCLSRLEIAYGGNGRFAPTCIRFKKAVQEGRLLVEDYSNYQMTLRFQAGAMGLPFLPVRSGMGTDIVEKWGFSRQMRTRDPRLPDDKLKVVDNPFPGWAGARSLVLVPAINPDVTIIHVQKADTEGTCQINGLPMADVEQAKSAAALIVTCEELVLPDEMKKESDMNRIPHFCVDAVVHQPWGAYPTACYRCYDYDPVYLNAYKKSAGDDRLFGEYLDKFVFGVKDHAQFLELMGGERLDAVRADPETGYAVNLKRA